MVATVRTYAFDPNHTVAGVDEDEQAQDECFRLIQLLLGNVGVDSAGAANSAGAWGVQSTSNSVTANTSNNIASATDIVPAAGGVAHSWGVYTRTYGTRTLHLCLDFNDAASPFRNVTVVVFPGAPTVAGTTTARPTHTNESILANNVIHSAAGFVPRTTHGWRADNGDFLFVMSQDGTTIPETAIAVLSPANGETGIIWTPHAFYAHSVSVANRGALGHASFGFSTNWETFWQDDTPLSAVIGLQCVLTGTSAWPNGRSNISNAIGDAPWDIVWSLSGESAYAGRILDIRATPENVPDNETQDGDTDVVRRITMGELWVPYRAAAGTHTL